MSPLNDLFDGIYCLNLPSSKDRRINMEEEFQKHNCRADFIPGVCPLDREFQESKRHHVDKGLKPRCYCLEKCNHNARPLRECEIAISLSHLKVYNEILKNKDEISLVVEDDVVFHNEIDKIVDHLFKKGLEKILLSKEPVIVFCGGRNNPGLKINNLNKYNFNLTKNGFYSNYCCIMNKDCAKILSKNVFPISRPDDSYKRYLIGKGLIKAYHLTPSLVGELSAGINVKPIYSRLSKKISRKDMKLTLEKSSKTHKYSKNKLTNPSKSPLRSIPRVTMGLSGVSNTTMELPPIIPKRTLNTKENKNPLYKNLIKVRELNNKKKDHDDHKHHKEPLDPNKDHKDHKIHVKEHKDPNKDHNIEYKDLKDLKVNNKGKEKKNKHKSTSKNRVKIGSISQINKNYLDKKRSKLLSKKKKKRS